MTVDISKLIHHAPLKGPRVKKDYQENAGLFFSIGQNKNNFRVRCTLILGSEILAKIGVDNTSRVQIFYNPQEPRILYLRQAPKDLTSYAGAYAVTPELSKGKNGKKVLDRSRVHITSWLSVDDLVKGDTTAQHYPTHVDGEFIVIDGRTNSQDFLFRDNPQALKKYCK